MHWVMKKNCFVWAVKSSMLTFSSSYKQLFYLKLLKVVWMLCTVEQVYDVGTQVCVRDRCAFYNALC